MEVYLIMKKLIAILMVLTAVGVVMTGCKSGDEGGSTDAAATTAGESK